MLRKGADVPLASLGTPLETEGNATITETFIFSFLGEAYSKSLAKTGHEIIEPKLDDTQCGFCPDGSTTDQIFTQSWILGR